MFTSKSPSRVLQVAFETACQALPAYRHRFSPNKFTQARLMPCLVLKEFACRDYRGLTVYLADHPDLLALIGLKSVPHYTTSQKAAQRLLATIPSLRVLDAVLDRARREKVGKRHFRLAAIDGTGLESRHVGRYFQEGGAGKGARPEESS